FLANFLKVRVRKARESLNSESDSDKSESEDSNSVIVTEEEATTGGTEFETNALEVLLVSFVSLTRFDFSFFCCSRLRRILYSSLRVSVFMSFDIVKQVV